MGLSQKCPIMPTLEKRPTGWRVKVRLAGYPAQSQTFSTKAQASAWGHEVEKQIRDGRMGIVKSTFQDVIDQYISDVTPGMKSGKNIAKRLKAISKVLPMQRQISEVTTADLSTFRDRRLAEVSVATVRKELSILQSVFESARRDWSMLTINPIRDMKKPPSPPNRKRLMSDDERDRVLMALNYEGEVTTINHQVAVAMLIALETAMRAGEIIGLTWDRVHLPEKYVSLELTKNGDRRDVPLSNRAVELIQSMRGTDEKQVFTVTSASLDALFRKAKARCEIDGLHFHDTRATALTRLASKLSILELARMVGHRDLKSLQIYFRTTATDLAAKLD